MNEANTPSFYDELRSLLNRFSEERFSNTPDFVLADYLMNCLAAFNAATRRRTDWYMPATDETEPKLSAATKATTTNKQET
jgi:hypothetical protein